MREYLILMSVTCPLPSYPRYDAMDIRGYTEHDIDAESQALLGVGMSELKYIVSNLGFHTPYPVELIPLGFAAFHRRDERMV